MEQRSYKVSAPGSLMLLGEHAVLDKKQAIVCAIEQRIFVTLTPRTDSVIMINNERLGSLSLYLTNIEIKAPFKYVLSAILIFKQYLKTGFSLDIHSDFSHEIGFGSSAAVTAATVGVLSIWLFSKLPGEQVLFQQAKKAITHVQEQGSCSDLAASIYGGVINYRMEPVKMERLPLIPDLTAVYCGYKKPTMEVIAIVNSAKRKQPNIYEHLFRGIDACVREAITAIKQGNWNTLGQLFMHHQGLQVAMGVSNHLLDTLVHQLSSCADVLGAKISGSGLGDCVIGLGALSTNVFPVDDSQSQQGVQQIPVVISKKGLEYEIVD